jgi:acetyl/propionyl-CoA carboxylase alpha subunit
VVDENTRKEVGERAVEIARLGDYLNAGTIEFLYHEGEFYFNEINARLQVEHPITELVTGMDLVKDQLRIAAGEELEYSQEDVQFRGWAVECRINAEDPYNNFMPSPGTVTRCELPGSVGVRVDSGIVSGSEIPTFYDPLFAKAVVWADNRERAVERMKRALKETIIYGVETNIPFHMKVLEDVSFRKGDIDTTFIDRKGFVGILHEEGKGHRSRMTRKAAALSAALAISKEGMEGRLKGSEKVRVPPRSSKWKMAGRSEQLNRRLN